MKHKLDPDLKTITPAELRQEIMKYRQLIRKDKSATNNDKWWLHIWALNALLPEGKKSGKITLPKKIFLKNCEYYYNRIVRKKGEFLIQRILKPRIQRGFYHSADSG